ncbi:Winged helix DNA-binding domain superfamily [Arabidopsis suecica]|uniref:Winged helix DNA-binding domain superfamily n=1 Tax=Arabidopsis suecica TaxID=45249 RepID=A0A8T2BNB4_ARASU|nr:Winged helix DNA-binding domain superfamily [Arabidopsis suecica]
MWGLLVETVGALQVVSEPNPDECGVKRAHTVGGNGLGAQRGRCYLLVGNSTVKRAWAGVVSGWVTFREVNVGTVLSDVTDRPLDKGGLMGLREDVEPTGIGKTTIARTLYNRISRQFQGSIFLDRAFISKSKGNYQGANPDDYNMKLDLQGTFLSEILGINNIKINHLGAVKEKLKDMKVLIVIDDLDDPVVLNSLVDETQWFGPMSRIVVITKDKCLLKAHGIDHIYEVCLPSKKVALQMFCKSAFGNIFPPEGFEKLAYEVAERAGRLPLGLTILGSHLGKRNKEDWMESLPSLRKTLDGKIENTLRASYDGLGSEEEQAIFRHIACFLNGASISYIKLMLEKSDSEVKFRLQNLVNKSFLHVNVNSDTVEMHCLLQEMGKKIVRAQSKEPGKREFLMNSEEICDVLSDNTGTKSVLGIALDIDEIDDLYPRRFMPSKFRPDNLVELKMRGSKLEELWKGVGSLQCLKYMDLEDSKTLKEIPDLSNATNLQSLTLDGCSSLEELPSSIGNLNKLTHLKMKNCTNLETFPTGINLQSLLVLDLVGCTRLKSFPNISTNISSLMLNETAIEEISSTNLPLKNLEEFCMYGIKSEKLWEIEQPLRCMMMLLPSTLKILDLSNIQSLVTIPESVDFNCLTDLIITGCTNLERFPTNMSSEYLTCLDLSGCSSLTTFPDVPEAFQIESLRLDETAIEVVPWSIGKFESLCFLSMRKCNKLKYVSPNIFKLENLWEVDFSDCGALTVFSWHDYMCAVAMRAYNTHSKLPAAEEVSSSLSNNCVKLKFTNCFNIDQDVFLQRLSVFKRLILPVGELPSYFTHQAKGESLANIPLLQTSYSEKYLRFRACIMVDTESIATTFVLTIIRPDCTPHHFVDGTGFNSLSGPPRFVIPKIESDVLIIFDCLIYLVKGYDHLDIRFKAEGSKIKGCGIRYCGDIPLVSKGRTSERESKHVQRQRMLLEWVSELLLSSETMAETRAQTLIKETAICEVEGALRLRFEELEGSMAKQNEIIDKNIADMFSAICLLQINTIASSSRNLHLIRQSPVVLATPEHVFDHQEQHQRQQYHYTGLTRLGKADFPRLHDGDKSKEWLFKVEEFYGINFAPNDLKVMTSIQFDGLAATWHQSLVQTPETGDDMIDWSCYKALLKEHFEGVFEDPRN